jgi:hypothetical protein
MKIILSKAKGLLSKIQLYYQKLMVYYQKYEFIIKTENAENLIPTPKPAKKRQISPLSPLFSTSCNTYHQTNHKKKRRSLKKRNRLSQII